MEREVAVGCKYQTPADQLIEQVDDDQKRVHRDIDEEVEEETPLALVGEDRLLPTRAPTQKREVVGGKADAPTGEHPDEPRMTRVPIKIERGKPANHHDENAKVDDEGPH